MFNLVSKFNFDPDVLKLMCHLKPFQSQWSPQFIQTCLKLIQRQRQRQNTIPKIQIITQTHTHTHIDLQLSNTFAITKQIFDNVSNYQTQINQYLNHQQSQILITALSDPNLIRTDSDFYYFVSHLPFYQSLLELIYTHIQSPIMPINTFIFPSIFDTINQRYHHLTQITYITKSTPQITINLQLLTITQLSSSARSNYITQIASIASCVVNNYQIKSPKPINLIYIPTLFQKQFDINLPISNIDNFLVQQLHSNQFKYNYNYQQFNRVISSQDVNSGVTIQQSQQPKYDIIMIWRKEEFEKVLFHELIHYYHLEKGTNFTLQLPSPYNINISNNYPQYSKEVFTELQTWLLYQLWWMSQSHHKLNGDDVRFILNYERLYALLNLYKIFKYFGLTRFHQFINLNNTYRLNLNCSVMYYYIFKAIILYDVDANLELLLIPRPVNQIIPKLTHHIKQQLIRVMTSIEFQTDLDQLLHQSIYQIDLKMMGIPLNEL